MKGKHTLTKTLIVGLICIFVLFVFLTSVDLLFGYPLQEALLDATIRSIVYGVFFIPFFFILHSINEKKNMSSKTDESEKLN
jgi:hypothetical protein